MGKELELYIHIPFCTRKCGYCDFLSASGTYGEQCTYIDALTGELIETSPAAASYEVSSVFIGGGTPSVLPAEMIGRILETVRGYYHLQKGAEISIECNPGSALRHKFAGYLESGINRLSIGLQSADNAELKVLGRIHTFEEFLKCYQGARMEGFRNINIDLINGFPTQTARTWQKTLKNVLMLKPEHISVYNLIVEEGTPICEQLEKGILQLPDEDELERIDAVTEELLPAHKYHRYEVSNYAREGYECRHNRGYWTGVPYLGFGLGASSYFEGCRFRNVTELSEYTGKDFRCRNFSELLSARTETEILTAEEKMREFMILGLRLTEGISRMEFYLRFGKQLDDVYGEILTKYTACGLLGENAGRVFFTGRGLDVSNRILCEF